MEREAAIFERAKSLDGAEREAYLNRACQGNPVLKQRLEGMLAAAASADVFCGAAAAVPSEEESETIISKELSEGPGTWISRYKLLQKIGEGGMGVVYMAEQTEPVVRKVALKIIKLGMDTRQVVARFEAERQALALMDHPNIARILDGGATETGRPYFVMELVQGIPITEFCDKNKLTARERLELFIPVCQAIQSAHQKGIIHRDIKPSNVLVTLHHGEPMPKVIDFGIAKATNQKLTEKTLFTNYATMIGTPAYMSPEQAEMSSLDVDTRTDVYSLGVLLYELLTGTTPFPEKRLRGAGYGEMQRIIFEEDPEKPSTRLSTMSNEEKSSVVRTRGIDFPGLRKLLKGDLDWIVMKCLEKDRRRRYETANALAADTERYLNNEPVVARPPTAAYRFKKAFHRNRLAFAAAAAITVALVLGTVVSTWQAVRATRASGAEKQQRLAAQAERDKARVAQQLEKQARRQADGEKAAAEHQLYVARMTLVQQAWEQNNVGRVRDLLDATANARERGFEWYYWQRQIHQSVKTLRGHNAVVSSVAFSPDGRRIVSGSWDRTARVWDVSTGKELLRLEGHTGEVSSVSFSPAGRRIVTGSKDQTARVWDARSGKPLITLKGPSDSTLYSVAFSPDGRRIAAGSRNAMITLWDASTGNVIRGWKAHAGPVDAVAYSPDGKRIVSGSGSPSADGSEDHSAKVWDADTGRELLTLVGHNAQVNSVAFSPDRKWIVSGSEDHTAKIWDADTGRERFALTGHTAGVSSAVFSPDGQRIVTGSEDQTARVWDTQSGHLLFVLKGHSAYISSVAFSPDGKWIATACGDWMSTAERTVKLWEAKGPNEAVTLPHHSNKVNTASFSPDGKRIVIAGGGSLAIFNTFSGQELLAWNDRMGQIGTAAFSPDGKRIVAGDQDHAAIVWDAEKGTKLLTLTGHSRDSLFPAFSPDGRRIVTGSFDHTASVFDAVTGRELQVLRGHRDKVVWIATFSPDGGRIATCSNDGTAKVWDTRSGSELLTLEGHELIVIWVVFSPDGRRIATGSSDRTARLWDADTGKELLVLRGHSDQVWGVAFSPDGGRLVTGSLDGTAKLWELETGHELLTLKGHEGAVRSVAFSPDGQRIATASWDHTAKVWQAATVQQVSAWQKEDREAEERLSAPQPNSPQ